MNKTIVVNNELYEDLCNLCIQKLKDDKVPLDEKDIFEGLLRACTGIIPKEPEVKTADELLADIQKRQADGIANAKASGVKFGRPRVPVPDNFTEVVSELDAGNITLKEALKLTGMSNGTFYRCRRNLDK